MHIHEIAADIIRKVKTASRISVTQIPRPVAQPRRQDTGKAEAARGVSALNDKGFAFRLTPPLIFMGSNLSCATGFDLETLIIPLRISTGDITLNVALRMKAL